MATSDDAREKKSLEAEEDFRRAVQSLIDKEPGASERYDATLRKLCALTDVRVPLTQKQG